MRKEISNLIKHARVELGKRPLKGPDRWMYDDIMSLLREFARQDHSGASATHVIEVFYRLAKFKPLGPLTGRDSEWVDIGSPKDPLWQNKRCSHVFKNDQMAWDIDGIVWKDKDGTFTNYWSRVPVTFPYTPKTVYKRAWFWRRMIWALKRKFSND